MKRTRKEQQLSGLRVRSGDVAVQTNSRNLVYDGIAAYIWYAFFCMTFFRSAHIIFLFSGIAPAIIAVLGAERIKNKKFKNRRKYVLLVLVGVIYAALVFIMWDKGLKDSVCLAVNVFLETMGKNNGIYYGQFPTNSADYGMAAGFAGILLSALSVFMVFGRNRGVFGVWSILTMILLFAGFHSSMLFGSLLGIAGMFLFLYFRAVRSRMSSQWKLLLNFSGICLLCAVIVAGIGILGHQMSGDSSNSALNWMKSLAWKEIDRIRYGSSVLPDGNIRDEGALNRSDRTALQVVMSKSESLYFRGFVGSCFKDGVWTSLGSENYYESYPLFYWLHEKGFYGTGQLSEIYRLLDQEDKEEDFISVKIQNKHASRKYFYLPYEYQSQKDRGEVSVNLADERLKSSGLFGIRSYGFNTEANLVKNYPELSADYLEKAETETFSEYAEYETYYNQYIYEHYLEISEEDREVLSACLGEYEYKNAEHMGYNEAKALIVTWLNKNLDYKESAGSVPAGENTLSYLLQERKTGYDIHYATAAALMYRYLGIPARYVEGYLLTVSAAENAADYEAIDIPESDAHAWVEIYQDGIGWVPVETVGAYMDLMEQPSDIILRGGGEGGAFGSQEDTEEVQEEDEKEPERKKSREERTKLFATVILSVISLVLFVFLILIVLLFCRRRKKILFRDRRFTQRDRGLAVRYLFQWAVILLRTEGQEIKGGSLHGQLEWIKGQYSDSYINEYEKTVEIVQTAVFSKIKTEESQYRRVLRFVEETDRRIHKNAKLSKRFMLWWKYPSINMK